MIGVKIFIFNLFSLNEKLKILLVTSRYFPNFGLRNQILIGFYLISTNILASFYIYIG